MPEQLLIVQRQLVDYRVPFFEGLRERLPEVGLSLRLAVGPPAARDAARGYHAELPWAEATPVREWRRWCWQSLEPVLPGVDYLVLQQENRLLANWPLLLARQPFRVALWGHGANLAVDGAKPLAQQVKQRFAARADWAFAYTEGSAARMAASLPHDRITVLDNAFDTEALAAEVAQLRSGDRATLRASLGLAADVPVAMFLGSLLPSKRIEQVLDAARKAREAGVPLQLVVAGGGPLADWLATRAQPWLHRPGPVLGAAKARWLAAADVLLHPAAIGLSVLDGFAAGLPLVTTDAPGHGPEAEYLRAGSNAIVCPPAAFAAAVQQLLTDPALAARLAAGARASAPRYTIAGMVERFVAGAKAWRESVPRRATRR